MLKLTARPLFAVIAFGGYMGTLSPIFNETKRRFYEDDGSPEIPPGTEVELSQGQVTGLGSATVVDGVSIRTEKSIESVFKTVRESLASVLKSSEVFVNEKYHEFNETETKVTTTIARLRDRTEPLLPNSIYILVAFLTGNIAARNRGFIAKTSLPVILATGAFAYWLPQTFSNTAGFIWGLEKTKLPAVAEQQEVALKKTEQFVKSIDENTQLGLASVKSSAADLKKKVVAFTGLNLDEEVSKK